MARRRSKTLASRYTSQAEQQAALHYAPENRALAELQDQAAATRDSAVTAAHTTSRGIRDALRSTRPEVQRTYDTAGTRLDAATNGPIALDLAKLGPAANPIIAAALGEQAAARQANIGAGARAVTDLDMQGVRATEGEAFAVRNALDRYAADSAKVSKQVGALAGEQGLYTATTLGTLVDKARSRAVTTRGQDLTAAQRTADRTSREKIAADKAATARRTAAAKKKAAAKDQWAPPATQAKAKDSIAEALSHAKDLAADPAVTEQDLTDFLTQGIPSSTTKNNKGESVHDPGVPKFAADYVRAALDILYGGYLKPETVKTLHGRKIKVRPLGYRTKPKPSTGHWIQDVIGG